jgi:hypothetical protein
LIRLWLFGFVGAAHFRWRRFTFSGLANCKFLAFPQTRKGDFVVTLTVKVLVDLVLTPTM